MGNTTAAEKLGGVVKDLNDDGIWNAAGVRLFLLAKCVGLPNGDVTAAVPVH